MSEAQSTTLSSSEAPGGQQGVGSWILSRPRIFLTLLCLAFFLPGMFSLPPLDRDESRFAQASKQMLETGDFVNIRFLDGARNKKPAGIHWMQAITAALAGGPEHAGIWAYRVPSTLGALFGVLMLYWAGRKLFDERTALLAASLLGASMALVAETNISKTDGVLIATVIAMQGVLIRLYLKARDAARLSEEKSERTYAIWFWVAMSISILIKGPIGPMVIAATLIAISLADKDWSWLKGLHVKLGLIIVAALVLPWAIAILITTSGVYYQESIGQDLVGKVISAQESHGAPPGYYLLLVTLTFFPGSLFLWPALANAWKNRISPQFRYLLAWLIPSWILFEAFPTKLPHYTLPTYPALALMTAAAIMVAIRGKPEILSGWLGKANLAAWTLMGLALAAFVVAAPIVWGEGVRGTGVWLSLIGLSLVFLVLRYALQKRYLHAMRTAIAAAFVFFASLLEVTLPHLERIAVSPRITAALESHYGEDHRGWPHIASTGFVEPSLVFLTATRTRLVPADTAALHLDEVPDGVALVESRNEQAFLKTAAAKGLKLEIFDYLEGHNYSNGRDVSVTFYRRADPS